MHIIDFRSDTVTKPTQPMLEAMMAANVGDDVYQDDPTVIELQKLGASLLGFEDALFVASGTMGNQLAIMTHTQRGDEVIVHKDAHVIAHEVGAIAVLSGANTMLSNNPKGYLDASDIRQLIRHQDIHTPTTSLVVLENALSNGSVVPFQEFSDAVHQAKQQGLFIHLDGARLFNAAIAYQMPVTELTHMMDSCMFCLSKGLGAPIGSLLCGSKSFIDKARKNRKLLGGGWRQAGILAAAGIYALNHHIERLSEDHQLARLLENKLAEHPQLKIHRGDINMIYVTVHEGFNHAQFEQLCKEQGILINPASHGTYRFVTHLHHQEYDIDRLADIIYMMI